MDSRKERERESQDTGGTGENDGLKEGECQNEGSTRTVGRTAEAIDWILIDSCISQEMLTASFP